MLRGCRDELVAPQSVPELQFRCWVFVACLEARPAQQTTAVLASFFDVRPLPAMVDQASRAKVTTRVSCYSSGLGERLHTGAVKGIFWVSAGDDGATLNVVCGVGGVKGPGIVWDDCVDEGVCGGGGW
jgi:hypothetical protein